MSEKDTDIDTDTAYPYQYFELLLLLIGLYYLVLTLLWCKLGLGKLTRYFRVNSLDY